MMRIGLFLLTNLAVIVVFSIVFGILSRFFLGLAACTAQVVLTTLALPLCVVSTVWSARWCRYLYQNGWPKDPLVR